MAERMFHEAIGGNSDDAVKYGLTLKAKCGLVWVPTLTRADGSAPHPDIPDCPECFPARPAYVYRCHAADGQLLYVGCTVAPLTRLQSHKATTWWWPQVENWRLTVFPTKAYALRREAHAIRTEAPRWNVRGQDFASVSLATYQEWIRHAVATEAPDGWLARLQREAARHYGKAAVLEMPA